MPRTYPVELTGAQIFGLADLVRRLGCARTPDGAGLRQDLLDGLNTFLNLLPEPTEEDGDAYLAAMRAGDVPDWGMDDGPLTETTEEWAAKVRASRESGESAALIAGGKTGDAPAARPRYSVNYHSSPANAENYL
jgi:hypothetical protein